MDTPHLRVAITTDSLIELDSNFASAKQVVFYDVSSLEAQFVDVVHFSKGGKKGVGGGKGGEDGRCIMDDAGDESTPNHDPLTERVDALKGCSILFTLGLSDVAAVRVHSERVFPVKSERSRSIDDVLAQVQRLMTGVPPLWLRRVMLDAQGKRLVLDEKQVT